MIGTEVDWNVVPQKNLCHAGVLRDPCGLFIGSLDGIGIHDRW